MSGSATVIRVEDEHGPRSVVTEADNVLWIHDDLYNEAADTTRHRIPGDAEITGDLFVIGVPNEGLGRITYKITGRTWANGPHIIHEAIWASAELKTSEMIARRPLVRGQLLTSDDVTPSMPA